MLERLVRHRLAQVGVHLAGRGEDPLHALAKRRLRFLMAERELTPAAREKLPRLCSVTVCSVGVIPESF